MTAALAARLDQALAELAAVKKELAFIESRVCQCEPQRVHDDYLHTADCIVAAAQQTAADR